MRNKMTYFEKIFSLEDGYKCFWTIEDFIQCKKNEGLTLRSSEFKVEMLSKSKFYLETEIYADCFDAFFYKTDGLSLSSTIHYCICLFANNEWEVLNSGSTCKIQTNGSGYGKKNLQWNTLHNGSLIVCFHLWNAKAKGKSAQCVMHSKLVNEKHILHLPIQEFSTLTPNDFSNFYKKSFLKPDLKIEKFDESVQTEEEHNRFNDLDDLIRLFKEKKFQYVILRTQTKEFAIQKALLCARSPVFNAMFDRDMKEKESNIVNIEDIDSDILSLFLRFLHLEPLGHLKWDLAVKLFYAADKYQIMELKSECITCLKKEVTKKNVCEAFELADMHSEEGLMQSAVEFFCKKSKSIIRSPEWKNLTLIRAELASEILCKMAEMLSNSQGNNVTS